MSPRRRPAVLRDAASSGPGLPERLAMGMLLCAMGLGFSAQWTLTWAAGQPAGGPPAVAVGGGILLAVLARTLGGMIREDGSADNEVSWGGLALGAGLAVAFTHFTPQAGLPAVLALGAVWSGWYLTGYVWRNLALAVPPLRDPSAGPDRDAHGQVVGTGSVDIAANVQAGVFGALLAGAAVGAVGAHLGHGESGAAGLLAAVALVWQCGCACLLVAQGQRRAMLREARIYQAQVLASFAPTAAVGALAVTGLVAVVALVLPAYPALLSVHALGAWLAHLVGGFVGHPAAGASAPAGPSPAQVPGSAIPHSANARGGGGASTSLSAVGIILILLLVVLAIFGLRLAFMAIGSHFGRRTSLWEWLRSIWQALLEILEALLSGGGLTGLWDMLARRGAAAGQPGGGSGAPRRAGFWERRGDARLRVRAAYRHMLSGVGGKGHHRPFWFSPTRFRRQLETDLPHHRTELSRLTGLYEEARYSTHRLGEGDAGEAESAADMVVRVTRAARDGEPSSPI